MPEWRPRGDEERERRRREVMERRRAISCVVREGEDGSKGREEKGRA